jgi:hypothetical protein
MKRILLAAIASLSLLVALPAISAAAPQHSRDHGGRVERHHRGDRDRGDRRRDERRVERFRPEGTGTTGTVQSFQNGVLTIALANGSTVSGTVTANTRVSCESMDNERDFARRDGGPGPNGGSGSSSGSGSGDNGGNGGNGGNDGNGGNGDHHEGNDPQCFAMLQHPGTKVIDAELNIVQGNAFWDEVELGL